MADQNDDPLRRPLPTVDMPLLRDDVDKARARLRVLLIVGGVLGVVGLVLYLIFGGGEEEEALATAESPSTLLAELPPEGASTDAQDAGVIDAGVVVAEAPAPEPTASPSDDVPTTPGATIRSEAVFGRARGFRRAVMAAGLSPDEFVPLEAAFEGVLDFRRCRPRDRMILERDPDGQLVRFEYHQNPTEYAVMTRAPDGSMRARMHQRPIERIRLARGGRIRTSLGEALSRIGLSSAIVGVFVEVFDGKLNLSTGAREGDTFRVIVEEERIDGEFLRYATPLALEYNSARHGTLRAFYYTRTIRGRQRGEWYDEDGREMRGGWLRIPLRYERMSSPFDPHRMHPVLRRVVPHNGTDFAASTGTPVWAAADGTVIWAGPKGPNGNLVSIDHGNGYTSHYAHLHRIQRGIREGVEVTARQLIGTVGTTGRSTGPHLHFGLKHRGRFVDPMTVLNAPGQMMPAGARPAYQRRIRTLIRELEGIDTGGDPPPPLPPIEAPAGEAPD